MSRHEESKCTRIIIYMSKGRYIWYDVSLYKSCMVSNIQYPWVAFSLSSRFSQSFVMSMFRLFINSQITFQTISAIKPLSSNHEAPVWYQKLLITKIKQLNELKQSVKCRCVLAKRKIKNSCKNVWYLAMV